MAVFERFSEREMIKNVASTLKGKNFSIREQFPAEIERRRKPLYPVTRKALEDKNNKVKMVRDKLYINNTLYKPSNSNSQVTNRDTNGQSFNSRGQHSRTYSNKSQINVRTPYRSNFNRQNNQLLSYPILQHQIGLRLSLEVTHLKVCLTCNKKV